MADTNSAAAHSSVQLEIGDIAHGGEGVGRVNGKAHFVAGVIPGEQVRVRVVHDAGSWARANLLEVVSAGPSRHAPRCPHAKDCGGCSWQHAAYDAQLQWKRNTLVGQLRHIGKIKEPPVGETISVGNPFNYRNRMDFSVSNGQPALHRSRSHDLVALKVCHLLAPPLVDLFERLKGLNQVEKVTIRAGIATGDLLAILAGSVPDHASDWGCAVAIDRGRRIEGVVGEPRITESVHGTMFRISGTAFFQNNTAGAAVLVDEVAAALEPDASDVLLDGYAGVGLFGACLGSRVGRVLAVESNPVAARDLQHNMKRTGGDFRTIRGEMERVINHLDEYPTIVVVDPPRAGMGEKGVAAVAALHPRRLAYVSCDPASLGRDAGLLASYGYQLLAARPIDLFPQTHQVETVATFAPV